jgi:copper(I)-binding protein
MMAAVPRPARSLSAAVFVLLLGVAGLVRGTMPQTAATAAPAPSGQAGIVVGGAYVRQPVTQTAAAAYLTIFNRTDAPDVLSAVSTGTGSRAVVHLDSGRGMHESAAGLTVPAHGSAQLVPGKGHVMIDQLYGPVLAGQTVNLELEFATAGTVLVKAPVIGSSASAPSAVTSP